MRVREGKTRERMEKMMKSRQGTWNAERAKAGLYIGNACREKVLWPPTLLTHPNHDIFFVKLMKRSAPVAG